MLIDCCLLIGCRWGSYTILWHKKCIWLVTIHYSSMQFTYTVGGLTSLQHIDCITLNTRFCIGPHMASYVRCCRLLDTIDGTKPFHVQFSRIQHWNWPHISTVWFHHYQLGLAHCILYNWKLRHIVVYNVVPISIQYTRRASTHITF